MCIRDSALCDAHFTLSAQRTRLAQTFTEDADVDHLVKNAADLVAADHVADGHVIDVDHAEPFVARGRLAGLAQAAQSIQSICTAAAVSSWTVHFGARP